MHLEELLRLNRTIRVIGFDDAPFVRRAADPVAVAGVICAGTRFEGMLWGQVQADGWDATETLATMLLKSKFLPQLHLVLLDGISMAGFNIIDLPQLAATIARPCVAVMRRMPKMSAIEHALQRIAEPQKRLELMQKAGEIHAAPPFYFQVSGADPLVTAQVLQRVSDRGHVPEALRVAHLITSAVIKGESGRQA
ncbi:DUF99 family protein [Phormidium tenue FACHB-886]|nr:DUF99 family protein [Phormidium tenue FACHB-886]